MPRPPTPPRLAVTRPALFTIAIEHEGDVHVHQLVADDEQHALLAWVATIDLPDTPKATLRRWRRHALHAIWFLEDRPVGVDGTRGVFAACPRLGRRLAFLHIIETSAGPEPCLPDGSALYTLVVDYLGGTYVSQHPAASARDALLTWFDQTDRGALTPPPSTSAWDRAVRQLVAREHAPRPLPGFVGVWTAVLRFGRASTAVVTVVRAALRPS